MGTNLASLFQRICPTQMCHHRTPHSGDSPCRSRHQPAHIACGSRWSLQRFGELPEGVIHPRVCRGRPLREWAAGMDTPERALATETVVRRIQARTPGDSFRVCGLVVIRFL
jgi:hypothetical protein